MSDFAENKARIQNLKIIFPGVMSLAIAKADELLMSGEESSLELALLLGYSYKIFAELEPAQAHAVIAYRDIIQGLVMADETLSYDEKNIMSFKVVFMILQDAINGDLPELNADISNCDYKTCDFKDDVNHDYIMRLYDNLNLNLLMPPSAADAIGR